VEFEGRSRMVKVPPFQPPKDLSHTRFGHFRREWMRRAAWRLAAHWGVVTFAPFLLES